MTVCQTIGFWFLSIVWLAGGVLGLIPAMMSPMMFDAPGASGNVLVVALFIAVATFPLIALASGITVIVALCYGNASLALCVGFLPMINVAIALVALNV